MRVALLGAGSWGTAYAKVLADAGNEVTMWARREEVAAAICYLASPAAGYTTGTALQIDGGTHSVVVPRT